MRAMYKVFYTERNERSELIGAWIKSYNEDNYEYRRI